MDGITEVLQRTVEQLLGRSSGRLHLRLILQPIIASTIAVKAGLKDARQGQPPFLWALFTRAAERKRLMRSGWKDIGKVFIIALLMDTAYQLFEFHAFYPLQTFIVAMGVAVVPYVVVRGVVTRLARRTFPQSPSASRAA